MGAELDRVDCSEDDFRRFAGQLRRSLDALAQLVERPGFGEGPPSIGAELELNLVDDDARPRCVNQAVLALAAPKDKRLALEINAFNLEINARPLPLAGRPFSALAAELEDALGVAREAAAQHGARLVHIGILPTLEEADLEPAAMTNAPRYHALSRALRRVHEGPFAVRIEGDEALAIDANDVTFEGANTSFQLHLRVPPQAYADTYNAAQVAMAPALAAACNSPLLLGRRLWAETRIALFRQSVDHRRDALVDDWRPARVSFGHGWVRAGAHELFAEAVALHEPLVPIVSDDDPLAVVRAGAIPRLAELRLHNGTIWHWNRAVYDDHDGGHLRVELRALPAGPSVADMTANAAFLLGLVLGLAPRMRALQTGMLFGHARRNFYEAARHGLDAELLWPPRPGELVVRRSARELIAELFDIAREGLEGGGVTSDEANAWLGIVADRVRSGITGTAWQRAMFGHLSKRLAPRAALAELVERYLAESASGRPVHQWTTSP